MGKSARRSIKSDDPSSPSTTAATPSSFIFHNLTASQTSSSTTNVYRLRSTDKTFGIGRPQNQIKNDVSTTSTSPQSPPPSASAATKSSATPTRTEKPPTTTYKAHTTGYKSTASTRGYHQNYTTLSRGGDQHLTEAERLKLKEEFYATYDVMTGIRIAATLGSFFVLMVLLIVYKSRSHTHKALKDPKIQARAAATVQEEEDREMQEAYEKTAFSLYADELDCSAEELEMRRDRIRSLGNVSCPPYLLTPNVRFSSIGGYSSLVDPSFRRLSGVGLLRRGSTSDSSRILSAYHLNDNYCNQNENFFNESDGEDEINQRFETTAEISGPQDFLSVPTGADSRRSSGMTCCSTESSFLERRCSAITLGLSSYSRGSSRRPSRGDSRDSWDYAESGHACGGGASGHVNINIIEPTPKSSPCPSERQMHIAAGGGLMMKDHIRLNKDRYKRKRLDDNSIDSITEYPDESAHQYRSDEGETITENVASSSSNAVGSNILANSDKNQQPQPTQPAEETRRAPLASLSSFKMSSLEFQSEVTEGSVFDDSCADDTDDDIDMEQFSTDSDELSLQSPTLTDRTTKVARKHDNVVVSKETFDFPVAASGSGRASRCSDKKSKAKSSECITINVDVCKEEKSPVKPSTPSTVILEMPVLATKRNEVTSSNLTDCLEPEPSTSSTTTAATQRKWSKETLF